MDVILVSSTSAFYQDLSSFHVCMNLFHFPLTCACGKNWNSKICAKKVFDTKVAKRFRKFQYYAKKLLQKRELKMRQICWQQFQTGDFQKNFVWVV